MKTCTKCLEAKPVGEFNRNLAMPDGLQYSCRSCEKKQKQQRRAALTARSDDEIAFPQSKRCGECKEERPAAEFNRARAQLDGLARLCRACDNRRSRETGRRRRERAQIAIPPEKQCCACGDIKPARDYWKSRDRADGLTSRCINCIRDARPERTADQRAADKARLAEHYKRQVGRGHIPIPESKTCVACGATKSANDFYGMAHSVDGLNSSCKSCVRARQNGRPRSAGRRAQDAAYYEANREHVGARVKTWARANPERLTIYRHRRRARKRRVESDVTVESRQALFDSYCGLCAYCHAPADTLDHIEPLFHGGADVLANLVPACRSCNGRKHTRPLLRWLMDMAA